MDQVALEDEAGDDHRDDNDDEEEEEGWVGGRREFETTGKGGSERTRNTKQRPNDRRSFWTGRGKRDPLPSIQTALELLPWIICKCIYFDFCPFLPVVSPYSFGLINPESGLVGTGITVKSERWRMIIRKKRKKFEEFLLQMVISLIDRSEGGARVDWRNERRMG